MRKRRRRKNYFVGSPNDLKEDSSLFIAFDYTLRSHMEKEGNNNT